MPADVREALPASLVDALVGTPVFADAASDVLSAIGAVREGATIHVPESFWPTAETLTGCSQVGFHAARDMDMRAVGLLYQLAKTAGSLRSCLSLLDKYREFVHQLAGFEAIEQDGTLTIRIATGLYIGPQEGMRAVRRQNNQAVGTILYRGLRELFPNLAMRSVEFLEMDEGDRRVLEDYFDCPVERCTEYGFVMRLPAEYLDLPPGSEDPYLHAELQLRASKRKDSESGELTRERIMEAYRAALAEGDDSITSVCRRLATSERSLRRRLTEFDISHRRVQRSVRLIYASDLLRHGNVASVSEVSKRCGFACPRSFARAFRQYFGKAPSDVMAA